jgi:predicted metal-dependent peptidase
MKKNEIIEEIKLFLSYIYIKHPFYNSLLSSIDIELESTEDSKKYGIYSFNNKSINIDKTFASKKIKEDKKSFFYYIIHELLHILLKHKLRSINKEKKNWNKASDIVVDEVIKKDEVLREIVRTPDQIQGVNRVYSYCEDKVDFSAEDIYFGLNKMEEEEDESSKKQESEENESSNCESCESEEGSEQSFNFEKEPFEQFSENGSHLNNHDWDMDRKDLEKEEKEINEKIIKAFEFTELSGNKTPGGVPGCFEELIDLLKKPQTNILQYITKIVQNFKKYSTSYKRGDRRYLYQKLIVPSKYKNQKHFNLLFYIDTSGSVRKEELEKIISEVYHVVKSLKSFNIDIVQSDVGISDIYSISNKDRIDMEKLMTIRGRGGTEMKPLFELLEEKQYDFSLVSSDFYIIQEEFEELIELSKSGKIGFLTTEDNNKDYTSQLKPLFH